MNPKLILVRLLCCCGIRQTSKFLAYIIARISKFIK